MKLYLVCLVVLCSSHHVSGLSFLFKTEPKGIFEVVKKNDFEGCKKLLSQVDVNRRKDGSTLLHIACSEGHYLICELLIAESADLEESDKNGWTPLHIACGNGRELICELLLSKCANKYALDKWGNMPLHWACMKGSVPICELLLGQCANIDVRNGLSWTPLHLACMQERIPVCKILLRKGANIEAKDKNGHTPLYRACMNGNELICELLIAKGANMEALDEFGWTPLHWACTMRQHFLRRFEYRCMMKSWLVSHLERANFTDCFIFNEVFLINRNFTNSIFIKKVYMGSFEPDFFLERSYISVCRLLLEKGANIEARDRAGRTPLLRACEYGQESTCTSLLKRGADLEAQDINGSTPLHLASVHNHESICKLLLEKGTNIEARDRADKTPLLRACEHGKESICMLLLSRSANLEAQDINGHTPLHRACLGGVSESICTLLLDRGANIEAQDKGGRTLLHLVCEGNKESACSFLLNSNADANAQDSDGVTPLMICCKKGHESILELLLKHVMLNKKLKDDTFEGTALHWACKYNNVKFCKRLLENGFDVHETADTKSLLHIACENNNSELVELFFTKQDNLNLCDKNGLTPLHLVCVLGHIEIVKKLVLNKTERNIHIDAKTESGKTPLHCAVENGHIQIVNILLKYGARPNEQDDARKAPLIYAAACKHIKKSERVKICKLIMKKLSTKKFSKMKNFLGSLIGGDKELEELFGLAYERVPVGNGTNLTTSGEEYLQISQPESSSQIGDQIDNEQSPANDKDSVYSGNRSTFDSLDQISDVTLTDNDEAVALVED